MPQLEIPLLTVFEQFENGQLIARPLLLPEISCLGSRQEKLLRKVQARVREVLENSPAESLHRRLFAGEARIDVVRVVVEPQRRSTAWSRKLELPFYVVHWRHDDETSVACVPALGIEVMAEDEEQLLERVRKHIRYALLRTGAGHSLDNLLRLCRTASLDTVARRMSVKLPTPKQRNLLRRQREQEEKSVLADVADDLSSAKPPPAYERDDLLALLAERLEPPRRESVLLVGPSGVGKTAVVGELARRRGSQRLRIWSTSGSRIVAGMSGFGMWQDRCRQLIEDLKRKEGVLHVGSLVELIEVGKHAGSEEGIAGYLRPYAARGDITLIAECTPEQLAVVERRAPTVLDAFRQINVAEPDHRRAESILLSCAVESGPGKETPIMPEALVALDRLHRRFATYSAFPGRPLRFLRDRLAARAGRQPVDEREVVAAFGEETGLPRFLLDDDEPLDLEATQNWFGSRIIAQQEPVRLIVDLLATVKAGLSRGGRPIASLLFIGPTGVGKTETAKALAEFLYRDPKRMVRIDMSEYADALSIDRLIGGTYAAEGLLTGKIRQQPFSVVLLDEFEKAHPSLLDLLLQVLGEGRLTDSVGRVADFTNSVVIMTSNLGARSFQRASLGFADLKHTAEGAREHFEREVRQAVRPELFNRIDRIVPFLPLNRAAAGRIARRAIELLRQRDGLRYRDVSFDCSDEAAAQLAAEGYSVTYGARPLVRAVERCVAAPLAHRLNTYSGELPLSARVSANGSAQAGDSKGDGESPSAGEAATGESARNGEAVSGSDVSVESTDSAKSRARLAIEVQPAVDTQTRRHRRRDERTELLRAAESAVDARRRSQSISGSAAVLGLKNELYQIEQLERRMAKLESQGKKRSYEHLGRLTLLKRIAHVVDESAAQTARLEDEVLTALYVRTEPPDGTSLDSARPDAVSTDTVPQHAPSPDDSRAIWNETLRETESRQFEVAQSLLRLRYQNAGRATLVVFAEQPQHVAMMARLYADGIQPRKCGVRLLEILRSRDAPEEKPPGHVEIPVGRPTEEESVVEMLHALPVKDWRDWLEKPHQRAFGAALQLDGEDVLPLLEDEKGLHVFLRRGRPESCLVAVCEGRLAQYEAPRGVTRRGAIRHQPARRTYDLEKQTIKDRSDRERPYAVLENALAECLEAGLKRKVWQGVDVWK